MRISELARRTGVSVHTLRYHEGLGLLKAARSASGYRDFDEHAVRGKLVEHIAWFRRRRAGAPPSRRKPR